MHFFPKGTPTIPYIIKLLPNLSRLVMLMEKEDTWKVFGQDPICFVFKSGKNEPIDHLVIVKLHHLVKISCSLKFVVFNWVYWAEICLACEDLVA
jgi:hypothetical protein